jgi:hypothetical protein
VPPVLPAAPPVLLIGSALAGVRYTDNHGSQLSTDILIIDGSLAGACCTDSHGSPLSPDILIIGGARAGESCTDSHGSLLLLAKQGDKSHAES